MKKGIVKKIFKWTGIILLLIIILAIALPFVFKDKIIVKVKEEANKNLNAKVDFGEFDLTLFKNFPDFTLEVDNVKIIGINEFSLDTLANIKHLEVSVNLMSVIKGNKYEIKTIFLDHPRILAKVLKDGKANWDITKPSPDKGKEAEGSGQFKMGLERFEIKEGDIVYDDASLNFKTALVGFNHTLSGDFTQDHFSMETMTNIEKFTMSYEGVKYLNNVKTAIKADLDADMPNFKFTFKENEIQLNELFLGFDGSFAMPKEDMDMDIKFAAKKTEFKNILSLVPAVYTKDFTSVKTSGKLALEGFVKGIYNEKKIPAFSLKLLIQDGMFQYPSLPQAAKDILVDVKVDNHTGVPDHTIININKFHVEMAGNPVDVKMNIKTPVSDPDINGEIIGRFNLATLKEVIPFEEGESLNGNITADIKLKGRMSAIEKQHYDQFNAKGQIIIMDMNYKSKATPYGVMISKMYMNFSPQFIEISSFDSHLGKSDLQADGRVENFLQYAFKDELLKGNFNIRSSMLNLSEFMTTEETSAAPTAPDTSSLSVIEVPENIDFKMTATIGKLIYDNLEMNNVNGALFVKKRSVNLDNLKMNTLGGSMLVNGSYSTVDIKKPKVDFKVDITDVDIPQTYKTFNTVQQLATVAKYCTGRFSTNLAFTTDLDSKMEPILNTLAGSGKLNTKHVVVQGFEPINKLADALKMEKYKRMEFSDINISYKFENGRVYTDPFDFKAGSITGKIGGSSGFDQTIDYVMTLAVPRSEFGTQANAVVDALAAKANAKGANVNLGDKISIQALFKGTVTKPIVETNLKNAAANAMDDLKNKAKEELDKKKKELEDKARTEVDKAKKQTEEKLNAEKEKVKAEAERMAKETEDKAKAEIEKAKKEAEEKAKKEAENKLKKIFGKPK